jgi:peptide deformylase
MPVVEILKWPDPRLSQTCRAVDPADLGKGGFPNRVRFRARVRDLVDTLANAGGLGLAAPQVGWMELVIAVADSRVLLEERRITKVPVVVMVNPRIEAADYAEASWDTRAEGCLSFPGAFAPVRRLARCKARWLSVDGEELEHEFGEWDAHCVAHELDHLQGVTVLDHLDAEARAKFLSQVGEKVR